MIRHYIKTAFRNLLKYKAQNIISIIGLSVGILCFSICLYCSRYINSTDKCFTHWERIADINLYTPAEEPYSGTPATLFESLRQLQFQECGNYRQGRTALRRFICYGSRYSLP